MIEKRPYVGWIGDISSGGLTLRPARNVDKGDYRDMPEIDLGHGIPPHLAHDLARELEDVLDRIVAAQRGFPVPSDPKETNDEG